ncbi:hypothetical protein BH10PSE19_BH10PSE19_00300 [soil metagenome]
MFEFKSFVAMGEQSVKEAKLLVGRPYELDSLDPANQTMLSDLFSYYQNFVAVETMRELGDGPKKAPQLNIKKDEKKITGDSTSEMKAKRLRTAVRTLASISLRRTYDETVEKKDSKEAKGAEDEKKRHVPRPLVPSSTHLKFAHYTSEQLVILQAKFFLPVETYLSAALKELDEEEAKHTVKSAAATTACTHYRRYLKKLQEYLADEKALVAEHMIERMEHAAKKWDLQNGDILATRLREQKELCAKENEYQSVYKNPQRDLTPSIFSAFYHFIAGLKDTLTAVYARLTRLWPGNSLRLINNGKALQAIPACMSEVEIPHEPGRTWLNKGKRTLYTTFCDWAHIVQQDLALQKIAQALEVKAAGDTLPKVFQATHLTNPEPHVLHEIEALKAELRADIKKLDGQYKKLNWFYKASKATLHKWQDLLTNKLHALLEKQIAYYEWFQHTANVEEFRKDPLLYQRAQSLYIDLEMELKQLTGTESLSIRLATANKKLEAAYAKACTGHFATMLKDKDLLPQWQQDEKSGRVFLAANPEDIKFLHETYAPHMLPATQEAFQLVTKVLTGDVILVKDHATPAPAGGIPTLSLSRWRNALATLTNTRAGIEERTSVEWHLVNRCLMASLHPTFANTMAAYDRRDAYNDRFERDTLPGAEGTLVALLDSPEMLDDKKAEPAGEAHYRVNLSLGTVSLEESKLQLFINQLLYGESFQKLRGDPTRIFNAFVRYVTRYDGRNILYAHFIYAYGSRTLVRSASEPINGEMLIRAYADKRFEHLLLEQKAQEAKNYQGLLAEIQHPLASPKVKGYLINALNVRITTCLNRGVLSEKEWVVLLADLRPSHVLSSYNDAAIQARIDELRLRAIKGGMSDGAIPLSTLERALKSFKHSAISFPGHKAETQAAVAAESRQLLEEPLSWHVKGAWFIREFAPTEQVVYRSKWLRGMLTTFGDDYSTLAGYPRPANVQALVEFYGVRVEDIKRVLDIIETSLQDPRPLSPQAVVLIADYLNHGPHAMASVTDYPRFGTLQTLYDTRVRTLTLQQESALTLRSVSEDLGAERFDQAAERINARYRTHQLVAVAADKQRQDAITLTDIVKAIEVNMQLKIRQLTPAEAKQLAQETPCSSTSNTSSPRKTALSVATAEAKALTVSSNIVAIEKLIMLLPATGVSINSEHDAIVTRIRGLYAKAKGVTPESKWASPVASTPARVLPPPSPTASAQALSGQSFTAEAKGSIAREGMGGLTVSIDEKRWLQTVENGRDFLPMVEEDMAQSALDATSFDILALSCEALAFTTQPISSALRESIGGYCSEAKALYERCRKGQEDVRPGKSPILSSNEKLFITFYTQHFMPPPPRHLPVSIASPPAPLRMVAMAAS